MDVECENHDAPNGSMETFELYYPARSSFLALLYEALNAHSLIAVTYQGAHNVILRREHDNKRHLGYSDKSCSNRIRERVAMQRAVILSLCVILISWL